VAESASPPSGFEIGHWSDHEAATGCTVVIPPPGSRCGVDVRGGGPGTRETEVIGPLSGAHDVSAVLLTGGSAFGLAAADGVTRWLAERGRGHPTPGGVVPIVPAAVLYDLAEGDPSVRPGAEQGYAACEAARPGPPERGRVGAGSGAAVGKILGRERAVKAGIGFAAARGGQGVAVSALAAVNAFGDVIGEDGAVLAGPREEGRTVSTAELVASMPEPPDWSVVEERNTTLVCVMTDAGLDQAACSRVARMTSGGVARAVDPVFSDFDGDVAFCVSSGEPQRDRFAGMVAGTLAATVTAAAIRDAVRQAAG
jgi:L-aminopeptidase/D-esterase-like protein